MLTGWNIPLIEFVEKVSPADLATMPPEMYGFYKESQSEMFHTPSIMHGDAGIWQFINLYHVWISPEGDVYSGDWPPYQWLVWKGWEEYADHLPEPPPGAPFPAPPYAGTPGNTLPIAKIPPHAGNFYGPMECPFPDAIADPDPHSEWIWTTEMKEALSALGLDPDIANTRLGYEKSGTTITMVGMTPSGIMKEWTLVQSKGGWTCDSASAEELENILFILEKIDAISGSSIAAPAPAVTEKKSLSSIRDLVSGTRNARMQPGFTTTSASPLAAKDLVLNGIDVNTVNRGNSSSLEKSTIMSGQSSPASISDRSRQLSGAPGAATLIPPYPDKTSRAAVPGVRTAGTVGRGIPASSKSF
ncbi:MAG: hypothetical protein QHH04_03045 [Methanolinea sp.]|nr:hypothetical protein [Methanolinea sp.]